MTICKLTKQTKATKRVKSSLRVKSSNTSTSSLKVYDEHTRCQQLLRSLDRAATLLKRCFDMDQECCKRKQLSWRIPTFNHNDISSDSFRLYQTNRPLNNIVGISMMFFQMIRTTRDTCTTLPIDTLPINPMSTNVFDFVYAMGSIGCTQECYIIALVLMCRLVRMADVQVTKTNYPYVWTTTLFIAHKLQDDVHYYPSLTFTETFQDVWTHPTNAGPFCVSQLHRMETWVLDKLDFRTYVSHQEFHFFRQALSTLGC